MVFACKTATFGSDLQVSMGPRLRLLICECKTACLDPEWCLSIGPSLHLCFVYSKQRLNSRITSLYGSQPSSVVFASKTAAFGPELQVPRRPWPHLRLFAFKTAPLAPELQVSMGPSPHLWFFHSKQRLLDHNYKPLWVQDLTCHFVHVKQRD